MALSTSIVLDEDDSTAGSDISRVGENNDARETFEIGGER
jgi:hypothetical protein